MSGLACRCGHGLIWHHENRGCGYHGYSDGRCDCSLRFNEAHEAIVQRAVNEALTEAADAITRAAVPLPGEWVTAEDMAVERHFQQAEQIVRARRT